eukprot:scaffold207704_cov33-Tisochrysis_lutea.AAC.1
MGVAAMSACAISGATNMEGAAERAAAMEDSPTTEAVAQSDAASRGPGCTGWMAEAGCGGGGARSRDERRRDGVGREAPSEARRTRGGVTAGADGERRETPENDRGYVDEETASARVPPEVDCRDAARGESCISQVLPLRAVVVSWPPLKSVLPRVGPGGRWVGGMVASMVVALAAHPTRSRMVHGALVRRS